LAGEWPTYGYRRLTAMMRRLDWPVNGKRVRRWMHELNLHGIPPPRKPRTTNSNHAFPRYPNVVADLEITRPDQVWVADITYIRLRREFVYLAVLMDVFTRAIEVAPGPPVSIKAHAGGPERPGRSHPASASPTKACSTPRRLRRAVAKPQRHPQHGSGRRAAKTVTPNACTPLKKRSISDRRYACSSADHDSRRRLQRQTYPFGVGISDAEGSRTVWRAAHNTST
jgi:hypothetical protein